MDTHTRLLAALKNVTVVDKPRITNHPTNFLLNKFSDKELPLYNFIIIQDASNYLTEQHFECNLVCPPVILGTDYSDDQVRRLIVKAFNEIPNDQLDAPLFVLIRLHGTYTKYQYQLFNNKINYVHKSYVRQVVVDQCNKLRLREVYVLDGSCSGDGTTMDEANAFFFDVTSFKKLRRYPERQPINIDPCHPKRCIVWYTCVEENNRNAVEFVLDKRFITPLTLRYEQWLYSSVPTFGTYMETMPNMDTMLTQKWVLDLDEVSENSLSTDHVFVTDEADGIDVYDCRYESVVEKIKTAHDHYMRFCFFDDEARRTMESLADIF